MNILDEIFEYKRRDVARRSASVPLAELKARIADLPPTRGFRGALLDSDSIALIAEVKHASPVKGVIREPFDAVAIAKDYQLAGVQCVSVLTDAKFFQGTTEDLISVRAAIPMPILRKDFTTSEYDVYEARAMGADAALLIVYGLSDQELEDLNGLGRSLGLDILIEAHTEEEAERALGAGATLLGINNRDLTTFETQIEVSERVIPKFADRVTVVSESALRSFADIQRVATAGAEAVLIGTTFCKSDDIPAAVREVMNW